VPEQALCVFPAIHRPTDAGFRPWASGVRRFLPPSPRRSRLLPPTPPYDTPFWTNLRAHAWRIEHGATGGPPAPLHGMGTAYLTRTSHDGKGRSCRHDRWASCGHVRGRTWICMARSTSFPCIAIAVSLASQPQSTEPSYPSFFSLSTLHLPVCDRPPTQPLRGVPPPLSLPTDPSPIQAAHVPRRPGTDGMGPTIRNGCRQQCGPAVREPGPQASVTGRARQKDDAWRARSRELTTSSRHDPSDRATISHPIPSCPP
jgi:hypothetical protein